jgi:rare lipoprotein A (peptidoglycan hydrolase)
VIDVSMSAARALGTMRSGVIRVSVEIDKPCCVAPRPSVAARAQPLGVSLKEPPRRPSFNVGTLEFHSRYPPAIR